jgi:hypothetical protein
MDAIPEGLPPTFSPAQMKFLTGLSIARLDQLAQSGVINRPSKSVYGPDSVVRYIKFQRESAAGPQDLRAVRVALMKEKLRLAQLDVAERERRVLPADEVRRAWVGIATTIKTKILAIGAKCATKLAAARTAAEAEAIVYNECRECLEELSSTQVTLEKTNGKRRDESIGA